MMWGGKEELNAFGAYEDNPIHDCGLRFIEMRFMELNGKSFN